MLLSESNKIPPRRNSGSQFSRKSSFSNALRGKRYSIALKIKQNDEVEDEYTGIDEIQAGSIRDISFENDSLDSSRALSCSNRSDSIGNYDEEQNTEKSVPVPNPPLICLPDGNLRTFWDIYMAFILFVVAFYVPFRVCLQWNEDVSETGKFVFILDRFIDITFAIDIILNFFSAYIDDDGITVVTDRRKIILRYLKGYFLIDVIATIPFQYILSHSTSSLNKVGKLGRIPRVMKILKIIRLLKLLQIYKLQKFLEDLEIMYNVHSGVSRMFKILVIVFTAAHLVGCFWFLIGISGDSNDMLDGGWVYRYGYNNKGLSAQYISAVYWAFSTLTTVGYGDISARTPQEQCYSMMMMLLGVSWYAYIVSSMATIMSSFDSNVKAKRDKKNSVREFCRAAKLPKELAEQVRGYFDCKLSSTHRALLMSCQFEADEILDDLSSDLRADIMLHIEKNLIDKIYFFRDKPKKFISDMIMLMYPTYFQENDVICYKGNDANEMFFVTQGKVSVCIDREEVRQLSSGAHFGEIGCILGGIRTATVRALSVCELFTIDRRSLNFLISNYPIIAKELKDFANNLIEKDRDRRKLRKINDNSLHSADKDNVNDNRRRSKQIRKYVSALFKDSSAFKNIIIPREAEIIEGLKTKLNYTMMANR